MSLKEYKHSNVSKQATRNTDNIKVAICCLSFLYQIDLEEIIIKDSLQEVKEKLKSFLPPHQYKMIEKVFYLNDLNYLDDIICGFEKKKTL